VLKSGLVILLFLPLLGTGQLPYFQNFVNSDGLESNMVYSCFQDKEGFMWFGTDLGVTRYNGYDFENFDSDDGLTGNEIFGMFQDSQERIWFRSFNGEFSYFLKDKFYNSQNDSTVAKLKSNSYLTCVFEDEAGTIYTTTAKNGVFILDTMGNVVNAGVGSTIYYVWAEDSGTVKLFATEGIYRVEGDSCVLENEFKSSSSFGRATIKNDKLLLGHGSKIMIYDSTFQVIENLGTDNDITWLGEGDGDAVFVGTRLGMYSYDFAKRELSTSHYFPESIISHTLIDREGNLWVTTKGEGVFMAPSPQTKIYNKEGDLPVNNVTCLAKGLDNDLWIGMVGGYYSNLKNGVIKTWRVENHANQEITNIRIAPEGQILISNKSNITVLNQDNASYFDFLGNDILIDSSHVYIASKQTFKTGLDFFFDQLYSRPVESEIVEELLQNHIMLPINSSVFVQGKGNSVYVGSQKGLFKDDRENQLDLSENSSKLSAPINDLAFDAARELLFVATNSEGLIVLENDQIKYTFNEQNGLSGNNCQSLLLDKGALWVGTTKSLDRIYEHENKFHVDNHGALLNLKDTKITDIERVDDVLYLATNDGLIAQNIAHSDTVLQIPKLYLEQFYVNSIEREIPSEKMFLKHHENSISFSFFGLSYKNLGNLTYEYKLDGFQKAWQKTKNREVFYDGLDAGNYCFNLRIKNESSESETISILFQIEKPIWKRAWFITVLFCSIVGILILIWFFRIRNIRANYELEKQIVSSELEKLEIEKAYLIAEQKAGVLQMNPHFLFNSLNTIKGYYAQNKFNEANRFISRFSKLLRRILECNTQFIPLEKEIEIVDLYLFLMQKRYNDMFEFEITCDIKDIAKVEIPPMMVQPMVENAVIHGIAPHNKGTVNVHFYYANNQLACAVSDTGIGFNKSLKQTHKSIGLSNIKDRLNLLAQQFNIPCSIEIISPNNKEKDEGTTVIILFPTKLITDESDNN
jgi:ligand-binding sensor domain-containing protein